MRVTPDPHAAPSLVRLHTQLRRDQRCEAATTLENWQQFLSAVALHHRAAARRPRIYRLVGGLVGLAAVGLIWVMPAASLFLTFGLIVTGLVFKRTVLSRSAQSLRHQATQHDILRFVRSLLAVLQADMRPGEPLRLRLDLRGNTVKAKQREERPPVGGKRVYPQLAETRYVDPWLAGETRLIDGSLLAWGVVDHIRQRTVTRRKSRGRIKRKTKYKVKRCIDVRLGVRQDLYTPTPATRPTSDHLRLRSGGKRHVIKARRVISTETLETGPQVRDILDLIAQAYQHVAPLRGKGPA